MHPLDVAIVPMMLSQATTISNNSSPASTYGGLINRNLASLLASQPLRIESNLTVLAILGGGARTLAVDFSNNQLTIHCISISTDLLLPVPSHSVTNCIPQRDSSVCQCNVDWLHNQTSSWLNKWLNSANVVSQMRLLMSNSTGASGTNINRKDREVRKHHWPGAAGGSSGGANNHWATWLRPKGNGSSNNSSSNNNNNGTLAASSMAKSKLHNQQPSKLVQGERGPQGPKVRVAICVPLCGIQLGRAAWAKPG